MIITDNGQMEKLFYDDASKMRNKMMGAIQEDFDRIMEVVDGSAKDGMYSVLLEHHSKNPYLLRKKLWDLGYDCVLFGEYIAIGWPDRETEEKEKEALPMPPYSPYVQNPILTTPVICNASGTTYSNAGTYTNDLV